MKKFDIFEMKIVTDCKNKDEKKNIFLLDRDKLSSIH